MCAYVNFCYSVAKLCLTLSNPVNCSTPGFPILHCLPEFAQTHVHWVTNGYLILCHPLILPSVFPSIRVSSNESALCIQWPKYWNFSFTTSPSKENLGFISFRIDWFDLLAVQVTLKSFFPTPQFKSIHSSVLSFLHSPTFTSIHDHWKNHSLH